MIYYPNITKKKKKREKKNDRGIVMSNNSWMLTNDKRPKKLKKIENKNGRFWKRVDAPSRPRLTGDAPLFNFIQVS